MAEVVLDNVVKMYGEVVAVDHVSLTIRDGEFVSLVGPSGCGKTTTLNMIAGLIELTDGDIYIGERLINDLDPKDRDIAMVFQNYALYPNKTVFKNLSFPLEMRGTPKAQIAERVNTTAKILNMEHLLDRRPRQLSGGQQQRVALGRALVRNPKVFLMDEPLSNLDAKLRVQMRAELKRFHQELNATVIYVTHDQMEAMTMSDRIAVMNNGVLQQAGSPDELYQRPVNLFVAGFIGSPAMNFLRGQVANVDGAAAVRGNGWEYRLAPELSRRVAAASGEVVMGVRHNHVRLYRESRPDTLMARIYTVEPTGDITYVHLRIGDHLLVASTEPGFQAAPDDPIWVDFNQEQLHLFDSATEQSLTVDATAGQAQAQVERAATT